MKILASIILFQTLTASRAFTIPATRSSLYKRDAALLAQLPENNNDINETNNNNIQSESSFDPLELSSDGEDTWSKLLKPTVATAATVSTAALTATLASTVANAASKPVATFTGDFNPDNFRPVCPASDNIYRFAQSTTQSIVGPDNFVEYGPLIAGGLLRVRLELCVVESFFNEAVGPFIEKEGLRWILPLHETVETFLAGTIFALASTFILVGSTKIVSVLVTYADVLVGGPARLFGGFAFDRAKGKPVTLDIGFGPFKKRIVGPGSPKDEKKEETLEDFFDISQVETKDLPIVFASGTVKAFGETSKVTREVLEAIDLFVGRYLTLIATGYIGIKFLHFKVFPDFPPF